MHRLDESLNQLIQLGRGQGYLTFSQVNNYLPDEAVSPEKLDNLLLALDEIGMEIIPDERVARHQEQLELKKVKAKPVRIRDLISDDKSKRIDDPVRMYLTQMGEIPLLTRRRSLSPRRSRSPASGSAASFSKAITPSRRRSTC